MYQYNSQRHQRKTRNRRILMVVMCAVIIGATVFGILALTGRYSFERSMTQLPFKSNDVYLVHDKGIVYARDGRLIGLDKKNKESFNLKLNAQTVKLAVKSDILMAYDDTSVQAVDLTTSQTLFFKTVTGKIADVSAGKDCVAVLRTDETGATKLNVFDKQGKDVEQFNFTNALISFGFVNGSAMWTLELDTSGITPISKISIYKDVGKSINGIVSVDGEIIEQVLFSDKEIFLVGTNHIIYCNYLGENRKTELVYGWELQDYRLDSAQKPAFLISPRQEKMDSSPLTAVKLVTQPGSSVAVQLPPQCLKVLLAKDKFYTFTSDALYEYTFKGKLSNQRQMPVKPDKVVRAYEDKALLISGSNVYMVTLP